MANRTEKLNLEFSYSSRPRPLQARRKYRNEPGQAEGYRNLMFDRRIVRGNTYAREDVLPVTAQVNDFSRAQRTVGRRYPLIPSLVTFGRGNSDEISVKGMFLVFLGRPLSLKSV